MLKTHHIRQGDPFHLRVPLLVNGVLWPVDGWKFWFTVKASDAEADGAAIIALSTDSGRILPHSATSVRIKGVRADTAEKPLGRYCFDIQGQGPNATEPETLEKGFFVIDPRTLHGS